MTRGMCPSQNLVEMDNSSSMQIFSNFNSLWIIEHKVNWIDHMLGSMWEIAETCTELIKKQAASPERKRMCFISKGNNTKVIEVVRLLVFSYLLPGDKRSCRSFSKIWLYSTFTASLALDQKSQCPMWKGHYVWQVCPVKRNQFGYFQVKHPSPLFDAIMN